MTQILHLVGGGLQMIKTPSIQLGRSWLNGVTIHTSGAVVQGGMATAQFTSAQYRAPELDVAEPKNTRNGLYRFVGGSPNFGHSMFENLTRFAVHEIDDGQNDADLYAPYAVWKGSPVAKFLDILGVIYEEFTPPCTFQDVQIPHCPMGRDAQKRPYVVPEVVWYLRSRFHPFTRTDSARYYFRRNAKHRRVLNEDAMIAALEPRGFTALDLADYPIAEQIAIASEAAIIIQPCGAGSPMSLFARGAYIELAPPAIDGIFGSRLFCAVLGNPYARINGVPEGRSVDADYTVSVAEVLKMVDVWEASPK